jgi:hypothetical protein
MLAVLAPGAAQAARGYRISLVVAPDPDVSGDPLTMVGTLHSPHGLPVAGVRLTLYHRVDPAPIFSPVQRTRTQAGGFFQIDRAEGVVVSNREWYIVARDSHGRFLARSRTVRERVFAELTLDAGASTVETGQPVTFAGTVSPAHTGERVVLERQVGRSGTSWRRLGVARIEAGGSFALVHRFLRPSDLGPATIRAMLPGDRRNIRSFSEPVEVTVQQAESASLTLTPSAARVVVGEPVTLAGRLVTPASGSLAGQAVTLYAHLAGAPWQAVATSATGSDGAFSFVQLPARNTAFEVRAAGRESATVFEGVRDAISATPSATAGTVGQAITIGGLVVPVHPGHVVYLQLRNSAGHFQTIQVGFIGPSSTYIFRHQLQSAGEKTYRVYIPGGPENLGAASPTFVVSVSPPSRPPALERTPAGEG